MSTTTEIAWLRRQADKHERKRVYRASRQPPQLSAFSLAVLARSETYTPRRIIAADYNWVVACVRAGDEHEVAEHLMRMGFFPYIPLRRTVFYRARGPSDKRIRRTLIVPVFGRYVFVGEKDHPLDRFDCGKIIAVLRGSSRAETAVALDIINLAEVQGMFDMDINSQRWGKFKPGDLQRGQAVRLNDGPFAGFDAIIEEINAEGRIKIEVGIFGRQTPIELDARELDIRVQKGVKTIIASFRA